MTEVTEAHVPDISPCDEGQHTYYVLHNNVLLFPEE